jgi:hypothetical protein
MFDIHTRCCFCGADNRHEPVGYGGERSCRECGKGGNGERDEPVMAYRTKSRLDIWQSLAIVRRFF